MELNYLSIAEGAYQAYAKVTGNKNYRGEEMPAFKDLPAQTKEAWVAATKDVIESYQEQTEVWER